MKYKIRKTGEIVEVLSYSAPLGTSRTSGDRVSFIDSKGGEHPQEKGNIFWDFEEVISDTNADSKTGIDWEQRRYEIAKEVTAIMWLDDGFAQRLHETNGELQFEYKTADCIAKEAIQVAEALINELKVRL